MPADVKLTPIQSEFMDYVRLFVRFRDQTHCQHNNLHHPDNDIPATEQYGTRTPTWSKLCRIADKYFSPYDQGRWMAMNGGVRKSNPHDLDTKSAAWLRGFDEVIAEKRQREADDYDKTEGIE